MTNCITPFLAFIFSFFLLKISFLCIIWNFLNQWSPISVEFNSLWYCDVHGEEWRSTRDYRGKETDSSSPNSYKMPIALQRGLRLQDPLVSILVLCLAWTFTDLEHGATFTVSLWWAPALMYLENTISL